ncbi:hypothetical protein HanIR_Chr01g0007461 [Helianthus annuus]|nr:hypothetical protein HanIR_Chr01g0007461 [Helianthus annuus]
MNLQITYYKLIYAEQIQSAESAEFIRIRFDFIQAYIGLIESELLRLISKESGYQFYELTVHHQHQ